jgi:hypothetical protein
MNPGELPDFHAPWIAVCDAFAPQTFASVLPRIHVKSTVPAGGICGIPPNGKPDTAA